MKLAQAIWKNLTYTLGNMLRETGLGTSLLPSPHPLSPSSLGRPRLASLPGHRLPRGDLPSPFHNAAIRPSSPDPRQQLHRPQQHAHRRGAHRPELSRLVRIHTEGRPRCRPCGRRLCDRGPLRARDFEGAERRGAQLCEHWYLLGGGPVGTQGL